MNPYMDDAKKEDKVKFREWEYSAKDMLPITEDGLRMHCGKPSSDKRKDFYQRIQISIAMKELKVTICEKSLAAELEWELYNRS